MNPYRIDAGPELDRFLHERLFTATCAAQVPPYSSDKSLARKVEACLRKEGQSSVTIGQTRGKHQRCFARIGSDPSTSTEVLADTYALAICRLAALWLNGLCVVTFTVFSLLE